MREDHKPDKIDIKVPSNVWAITDSFKNPILLNLDGKELKMKKI